jgi:hypothetical protein
VPIGLSCPLLALYRYSIRINFAADRARLLDMSISTLASLRTLARVFHLADDLIDTRPSSDALNATAR